jgi:hypothetical protein
LRIVNLGSSPGFSSQNNNAQEAQLVEQKTEDFWVVGSIPTLGNKYVDKNRISLGFISSIYNNEIYKNFLNILSSKHARMEDRFR